MVWYEVGGAGNWGRGRRKRRMGMHALDSDC